MTREFKVGDRVRLSDVGREEYLDRPSNPHEGTGLIKDISLKMPFGLPYNVVWSGGYKNDYRHGELTHADPVPIGYTGKLRDMDLQEGDVVGWYNEDENGTRWTVMGNGDIMGRQMKLSQSYFGSGHNSNCDKFVLISRANTANATTAPTWSDWLLSRKDGTMSQQYAEVQTVPLDDTQQVVYRGRGEPVRREVMTVSVAIIDGQPDWDTVEEVVL